MLKPRRRTKIIATLGPASQSATVIEALIQAGVNVIRLNFSHGDASTHQKTAETIRHIAATLEQEIAIIADLQGPKIRIARFIEKKITLKTGDKFCLDAQLDADQGTQTSVGIDYKQLPQDVHAGDTLLLDDGRITFKVMTVKDQKIFCEVLIGGELSNNKGINRLGGGLSAQALTEKDKADIKIAAQIGADYVAVSFPRSRKDIDQARTLIQATGSHAGIIAKIERSEAVSAIDEIIEASDAVMVARGDLGVEIGEAELPGVQKHIITRTRALNKAVIIATQMMESMIHNSIPTRAEVFDVANAVLDGTDAVMLSAETAIGDDPANVVQAMSRICLSAEQQRLMQISQHRNELQFNRVDEAIAMAAMYTANHLLDIKAILALTESGCTPLWMSRIRSGIPIFALCRNAETRQRMCLFRGVYPLAFDPTHYPKADINQKAIEQLQKHHIINEGDRVLITKGDLIGEHGGTNMLKILTVDSSE